MGEVEFLQGTGVGGGATVKRGKAGLKFSTKHRPASPPSSGRPDCAADFINSTEFAENPDRVETRNTLFLGHGIKSWVSFKLGHG